MPPMRVSLLRGVTLHLAVPAFVSLVSGVYEGNGDSDPTVRDSFEDTEIPADEGRPYLATVEDLASRRLPEFAIGEHHDAKLAKAA